MDYSLIVVDTETSGLLDIHDIIELSLIRLSDGEQKTWFVKPINLENIDPGALRVNKHKLEDLLGQTKYGRDTYQDPNKVIIEVENFLSDDGVPTSNRVMVAQNVSFDMGMMQRLWEKCNSKDSFPFGRRVLDTMQIAFMMDYVEGNLSDSYSLSNLIKKYGIKNNKAHSAESDTLATKELFIEQVKDLKKKMNIK